MKTAVLVIDVLLIVGLAVAAWFDTFGRKDTGS